nr:MAG TPA: hypothetical protein [Caudoviricetes sp.]
MCKGNYTVCNHTCTATRVPACLHRVLSNRYQKTDQDFSKNRSNPFKKSVNTFDNKTAPTLSSKRDSNPLNLHTQRTLTLNPYQPLT